MSTPDYRDERLASLRAAAADRPAHARYLERLIASRGEDLADTYPPGVSRTAGEALEWDVWRAEDNTGGFGRYATYRARARRTAALAADTRRRTALQRMLPKGQEAGRG